MVKDETSTSSSSSFGLSDEEFQSLMAQELQKDPLAQDYPTMFHLGPQCLVQWRRRYRGNRSVWLRLFNKERVLKEFIEAVPIMDAVYQFVEQQPEPSNPKERFTIVDLASGKGYLSMFLSEMLPPSKIRRFVLMDKQWPMHGTVPQPHHMSWEHIYGTVQVEQPSPSATQQEQEHQQESQEDHGDIATENSEPTPSARPLKYIDTWPIPLTTSKQDLKHGNQRRNLEQTFFCPEEGPVILLAVHLCGTLSLKAVQFFNNHPDTIRFFALKPCCLPGMIHAKRHEVFSLGDHHSFDSKLVCVPGKWNKDKWCGPNRASMAKTFNVWAQNLYWGINDESAKKAKVNIPVQHDGGYQNEFLFAERLPATQAVWDSLESHQSQQEQEPIPTCVLTKLREVVLVGYATFYTNGIVTMIPSLAEVGDVQDVASSTLVSPRTQHTKHTVFRVFDSSIDDMTPEELLEAYYYKGLNKGDSGEPFLREILEEDIKFRGVFGHKSKRGIQAVLDYFRAARNALGKYTFEIEDMIVSKDDTKASVRVTCRGVHKNNFFGVQGSGHEVHFTAAAFFQFRQTDKLRISEFVVVGNLDDLKRQIGADTSHDTAFQIPSSISVPSSSSTIES